MSKGYAQCNRLAPCPVSDFNQDGECVPSPPGRPISGAALRLCPEGSDSTDPGSRGQRRVLGQVLQHLPHAPLLDLRIDLLRHGSHPSNSQGRGIKPRALHVAALPPFSEGTAETEGQNQPGCAQRRDVRSGHEAEPTIRRRVISPPETHSPILRGRDALRATVGEHVEEMNRARPDPRSSTGTPLNNAGCDATSSGWAGA